MTGGQRPFLGWADELEEFEETFRALDPLESRRPDPAIERMLEQRLEAMLESSYDFARASRKLAELFESGTVHHRGDPSRLFADPVDRERESDMVHAHRTAIEALVARYAADHPDVVQ